MSGRKSGTRKIDSFINQYQLSKTLRFKLIPQGETLDNFKKNKILDADKDRANDYATVKQLMDEYIHKPFIEKALSTFEIPSDDLKAYIKNRDDDQKSEEAAQNIRKKISGRFTKTAGFNNLFGKEIITALLENVPDDKKEIVKKFAGFSTYFTGFNENRANLYTGEGKATEIAYRVTDQNLPKFLDNAEIWKKIRPEVFPEKLLKKINKTLSKLEKALDISDAADLFQPQAFNKVLTQSGIDLYNQILGGYSTEDNTKIQGLNEYINEYNQKNGTKHPTLKQLYKQMLSDRGSVSYIPPAFTSDTELLTAIRTFWNGSERDEIPAASAIVKQITELFADIQDYDPAGLFISGLLVSALSNKAYDVWSVLRDGLGKKFSDDKSKSYSLKTLQEAGNAAQDKAVSLAGKIKSESKMLKLVAENKFKAAKQLLSSKGENVFNGKNISAKIKEANITLIREFLDSVKDFQQWAKLLTGTGKESGKDERFYSQFTPLYDALDTITPLYNKVRNYLTKKPYSTDKIKLNFDNPTFLGGWAVKKEVEYSAQILRSSRSDSKNGYDYYLLVMDKEHKAGYKNEDLSVSPKKEYYEKMVYNQVASPTKDIPTLMYVDGKAIKTTGKKVSKSFKGETIDINPRLEAARKQYWPKDIYRIFSTQSYKPDTEPDKKLIVCENDTPKEIRKAKYSRKDLETLIDYFQKLISDYLTDLTFHFKPAKEYQTYQEFLDHTKQQGYQVEFKKISKEKTDQLVKEGHIYLFQIYSKDFSPYSQGTPNMHTLYFKALFDKANLDDVTFKLSGGAEMFYREASIARTITHPKNKSIDTKNPLNPVKKKTFNYDLIKDKRYTEDQFMLHIPIALNFKAGKTQDFNQKVRDVIKECDKNYVIGIDRGERNLIYVCVTDEKGNIVEQFSLNDIVNEYKGGTIQTDYHQLLDSKGDDRKKAQLNWTTIANIKELKEGYISQVVHKICQLIEKYDAVIAMEDLNQGFKRGRQKVEKQVYQKFEKMLIDKLNFYADKKKAASENGGILNAYQLTTAFQGFDKMKWQNGFIFYVPARWTSKIDPVTGFINLLKVKYSRVTDSQKFFSAFDRIWLDKKKGYYCFEMDMEQFKDYISAKNLKPAKTRWTICSHGDRIETFKNKKGGYDSRTVVLTDEFNDLFQQYGIDTSAKDLRPAIAEQSSKDFFEALTRLLRLTLQIRNSRTGTQEDYLISPVRDDKGNIFDSRNAAKGLPENADANGAYHIARKALWIIDNKIKGKAPAKDISIKDSEWVDFVQGKKC